MAEFPTSVRIHREHENRAWKSQQLLSLTIVKLNTNLKRGGRVEERKFITIQSRISLTLTGMLYISVKYSISSLATIGFMLYILSLDTTVQSQR